MKRELCIYCKMVDAINGQMGTICVNRDSLIRAPLVPGQSCPMFRKDVACPFFVEGASDQEIRAGYDHAVGLTPPSPDKGGRNVRPPRHHRKCRCHDEDDEFSNRAGHR